MAGVLNLKKMNYQELLIAEVFCYINKYKITYYEIEIASTITGNTVCFTFERDYLLSHKNYLYNTDINNVEVKLNERFELRKAILIKNAK